VNFLLLLDDGEVEPDKTIQVILSDPVGATIEDEASATATILDDELPANVDFHSTPFPASPASDSRLRPTGRYESWPQVNAYTSRAGKCL
jgi:hypothetical protein